MNVRSRLLIGSTTVVCLAAPAAAASAAPPAAVTRATSAAASAAHHHKVAGDIDGDGRSDLVIGELFSVRISYTHASPGGSHTQTITLPDQDAVSSIAVGDVTGDGYADLVIGSDEANENSSEGVDGAFFICYGSAQGIDPGGCDQDPGVVGSSAGFGASVTLGDVNGDGKADLVVGDDDNSGRFTVLHGSKQGLDFDHPTHLTVSAVDSVAVGDVNHDGRADLVFGRPGSGKTTPIDDGDSYASEGTVEVLLATKHGFAKHHIVIHGRAVGVGYGGLGSQVAVGKVDGDAYADVVVGVAGATVAKHAEAGKVVVLFGGKKGVTSKRHTTISQASAHVPGSPGEGQEFGAAVSVGDVDGDGYGDLVIGATQPDTGHQGAVFVVRGTKHGITTTHTQRFTESSKGVPGSPGKTQDLFGSAVTAFHPRGTTYASIAVSAPGYAPTADGYDNGAVVVLRGGPKGVTTKHGKKVLGTHTNQSLGELLAP